MSSSTNIQNCLDGRDKPLVLEPYESAWLAGRRPEFIEAMRRTFDHRPPKWHGGILGAIYECELRDAVIVRADQELIRIRTVYDPNLPKGERAKLTMSDWINDVEIVKPTFLQVWRAAAKILRVGPWANTVS